MTRQLIILVVLVILLGEKFWFCGEGRLGSLGHLADQDGQDYQEDAPDQDDQDDTSSCPTSCTIVPLSPTVTTTSLHSPGERMGLGFGGLGFRVSDFGV